MHTKRRFRITDIHTHELCSKVQLPSSGGCTTGGRGLNLLEAATHGRGTASVIQHARHGKCCRPRASTRECCDVPHSTPPLEATVASHKASLAAAPSRSLIMAGRSQYMSASLAVARGKERRCRASRVSAVTFAGSSQRDSFVPLPRPSRFMPQSLRSTPRLDTFAQTHP